jgi:hypothetical protein
MKLAELIQLQKSHHGPKRLRQSLGDGYLYEKNPIFRRIRDAALASGFRYTLDDPGSYFAFPLISLHTLLATRRIPYRDNVAPLGELERARPSFFRVADLTKNRPMPNYLLHESAHGVSFVELFGAPKDVEHELRRPDRLVHVMFSEAYAMTTEYLAACAVSGSTQAWLFSISSYRHRTQKKKAIGELVDAIGIETVTHAMLGAFLYSNFLVDRLGPRELDRILGFSEKPVRVLPKHRAKLRTALNELSQMNPEFRLDTARLFLTMFGHSRNIRRVLDRDPIELAERDPELTQRVTRLVRILTDRVAR